MGVHFAPEDSISLEWVDCRTCLGGRAETTAALLQGVVALAPTPVLSVGQSDLVPLALCGPLRESSPPRGWDLLADFVRALPEAPWGTASFPVIVASSNFGVGSLLEFSRERAAEHLPFATPHASIQRIREMGNWGPDVMVVSHACVSAQLALFEAERRLAHGGAEQVLVFAYDLLSDFVTGGFHALKILNGFTPVPFMEREVGAIGLGDGMAAAILSRSRQAAWRLGRGQTWNEMFHMTSNDPSGSGFAAVMKPLVESLNGRRVWLKGHGTGTLDAGRMEVAAAQSTFGEAPLVSWKGSLGHTLGSCALVELAVAVAAMEEGRIPGCVHGAGDCRPMGENVATDHFEAAAYDGFVLLSNAFGGAHAGALVYHA